LVVSPYEKENAMLRTNSERRRSDGMRAIRLLLIVVVAALSVDYAQAGTLHGSLSVSKGASILDDNLAIFLNDLLDPEVPRLIVLTECFGGNTVGSFANRGNTSVISATSRGELATYGKYDLDAANALKPGAGTTAKTVHDAGIASKDATETPTTGGGIKPQDYPLEKVTNTSAVKSRHVLVYAGKPDGGNIVGDVVQRDKIKANFAGEPNTTVRSVGGPGGGGWDYAGSATGLRQALKDIESDIQKSGNPPSSEQFILFVTDHGDTEKCENPRKRFPAKSSSSLVDDFSSFTSTELDPMDLNLANDPNNQPAFSIFIPFTSSDEVTYPSSGNFFNPGDWTLSLHHLGLNGQDFTLSNSFDQAFELDGDNILGNADGSTPEGIDVFFSLPFPINTPDFNSSFFDMNYEVSLANNTFTDYTVDSFCQDSGAITKRVVPEPATLTLCGLGMFSLLGYAWRRRRRTA
jgi:hypothetical protein